MSNGQLSHWRRKYFDEGETAFTPEPSSDLEREVQRLRRENARLKEEQCYILYTSYD